MNLKKYFLSPFFYLLLALIGYFSFTKIADGDFGFHLAQGKYFLENHWSMLGPSWAGQLKEIFSYSIFGQQNIILSWLFDVWVYFLYLKLGSLGLSLWKAAVMVLLGILFIFRLENLAQNPVPKNFGTGHNQWLVYASTLLFLASIFNWANIERPHALGYIFFSAFLLILLLFLQKESRPAQRVEDPRSRETKSGQKWHLFALLGLQLLWANSHTSFFAGPLITAIFWFGLTIEYYYKKNYLKWIKPSFTKSSEGKKKDLENIVLLIKKISLLLIFQIIISAINPYGFGIFANFFQASPSAAYKFIQELWPMQLRDFASLCGLFWLLSLIPLIKFWRQKDFKMVLTFLSFAFLGLHSSRFSYDYVVLTAPFTLSEIFVLAPIFLNKTIVGLTLTLIFSLVFVQTAGQKTHGAGFSENDLPIRAGDFVLQQKLNGKMFNSFGLGSYLIWHLFPQYQVFIDTRAQNYVQAPLEVRRCSLDYSLTESEAVSPCIPENSKSEGGLLTGQGQNPLLLEYYKILEDPNAWQKMDKEYDFDFAIVDWPFVYNNKIYNQTEKNFTPDKWAPVFFDARAIVYLKRNTINQSLIENYEYKYIRPQQLDPSYFQQYLQNPYDWLMTIKEFQRAFEQNPDNYRLHFMYASFLVQNSSSDQKEIIEHLKKTLDLNPKFNQARKILKTVFQTNY